MRGLGASSPRPPSARATGPPGTTTSMNSLHDADDHASNSLHERSLALRMRAVNTSVLFIRWTSKITASDDADANSAAVSRP